MARVNCDPHSGRRVFALVNQVTGLVDTEDQAMAMVQSLEKGGVATDDIDVFVGEEGARCLDLSGREHGRFTRLLRRLEAVGDEHGPKRRIEDELTKGHSLVCVKVHRRYGHEKPRAFKLLESMHAHEIHYWGAWSYEGSKPSAVCAFCALPAGTTLGENEHAMWILDSHPVSPGHSLIILKRHLESFFEATWPERQAMLSLLDQAQERVFRDHAPSGYNIGFNEGASAGQAVSHVHMHLIPRYAGDSREPKGIRWVIPDKADYFTR